MLIDTERQKAYRARLKSQKRGKSELRLIVENDTILALKRLSVRYKNKSIAKTLQTAVDRMERGVTANMHNERRSRYYNLAG